MADLVDLYFSSGFLIVGLIAVVILILAIRTIAAWQKLRMNESIPNFGPFIKSPENDSPMDGAQVQWPVEFETSEFVIEAETMNISIFGAFIVCDEPLDIGETIRLSIKPPNREPITVDSAVTWNNAHVKENMVRVRGMGVRFDQLSDEDREFIKKEVATPETKSETEQPEDLLITDNKS